MFQNKKSSIERFNWEKDGNKDHKIEQDTRLKSSWFYRTYRFSYFYL